ncbi:hypothetical protein ACFX2G_037713 [Malus domestica]
MREFDFSGSTFNGAYMEKAITYKANFEEPPVKKMGPNSELHFSSLKIRRKHFLSSIFQHLRYICALKPSIVLSLPLAS